MCYVSPQSIEYRLDYLKVCIYSEYSFGTFVLCRLESTLMQLVVVVNIVHGLFIFCCCSCKDNVVRCLANGDDSIRSQTVCVSFSYAFFLLILFSRLFSFFILLVLVLLLPLQPRCSFLGLFLFSIFAVVVSTSIDAAFSRSADWLARVFGEGFVFISLN